MLIVGAKGFAKQLIEILYQNKEVKNLFFFDNISENSPDELYNIKIIKSLEDVSEIFMNTDEKFCLGLSGYSNRRNVVNTFENLGGKLTSVISKNAFIATYVKSIGNGTIILTSSIVENDVSIGAGVLINSFAAIYHDCIIGNYTEIAPGAKILGGAEIGENCFIGANATILPKIKIANNVTVGAGAVVIKDVQENTTVIGVPAKPIIYK